MTSMRTRIEAAILDKGLDREFTAEALADAVLDAMREPTLEQVDAGMAAHRRVIDDGLMMEHSSDTPYHCYRAMIDAAKSESPLP